jgi:signal transduction histidine kinase
MLLEALIVFLGVAAMALWMRQSSNNIFNTSMLGGYAYYSGLGFLAIGMILLLWRRPDYWGYGILMLVILLAGYMAQYFISQEAADYGWFVHLGEMVAYLILLALPIRLASLKQEGRLVDEAKPELVSPRIDAKSIQSLTKLIMETSPQQYYQELNRWVAQLMDADFSLLVMPPKTGAELFVPVGYNRQQDRMIDGFAVDGRKMPLMLEAVTSGKTLRLAGSTLDPEVHTLTDELGMKQTAQLLVVPLHTEGSSAIMAIVVLSDQTNYLWNDEDARQLKEITEILASTIKQDSKSISQSADQAEMMKKLQSAQAYSDQVNLEYAKLKAKYDSFPVDATASTTQADSMAALVESQKNLQDTVTRLETRNRELENLLVRGRPSMEEVEQLRLELRSALTDLARIPSTLSKSDQKMLELQLSAVKRLDEMQPTELVTSIAQECRQPLSSIVGYTDLLLGESVGLLGAMQRKFLERVKASTERLGILLNELIQVMSIDDGKVDQTQVSVDLEPAIDEAVNNIIAQIREKNIAMRVDLPEKLPAIRANKDALQQILENLLQNACLVTPVDGEIRLFARVEQQENEIKYLLISIADQGGGIEPTDLPRVFSRRYKVENPLIHGVGDTGVGLSIVKSLVELHKGRVWVDTQAGVGSTLSILLPLAEDQSSQINPEISTSL